MIWTYVGLGANLGDRRGTLEQALTLLGASPGVRLLRVASLYETEPVEAAGGWFLNSVAAVGTSLSPEGLLERLLRVEDVCGRPRLRQPGQPRVVDLDLLLYGSRVITTPQLQVPHPRMHLRRFVLEPLAELDPGLLHPGLAARIGDLLSRLALEPEVRLVARDWYLAPAAERRRR